MRMGKYMKEKEIEQKLIDSVKALGGLCEKWTSGTGGWPDRIVLLHSGSIAFVEVKTKGKKPRALQLYRHRQLKSLGFRVYVLDDEKDIGGILDDIQST